MPMLQGRRPETTEAERKATGAFATLAPFRDGNIYSAKFSGRAAWERHPNGDELVQIVAGSTIVNIIVDDKVETHELSAGTTVIVPQAPGIASTRQTASASSPRRRGRPST